ncbi:MAG TPA: DHA2 family efflux MFS transporter permease subunit [Trebonia sp.]
MSRWRGNQWAVLATLSLGFFMALLDLTIVSIAIPSMQRGLHASLSEIGWVLNAYVIMLAVLMITAGRLGDLRGKRTLFIAGIAVFTLASAACGLSQNAAEVIAARSVQGLGAALFVPQTMAVIIAIFPPGRRGTAMGIWGGVAGLATIAGPTIGGLLVSGLGWRWIFFVNLPIGVVTIVLAATILPEVATGRHQRLDPLGVVLASAALVAVTFGLVEGQSYDWGRVWSVISIPLILAVGVILLAVFLLVQARRQDRDPLLPFGLFADRGYALMGGANMMVSVGLVGMALPLTLFLQSALGFSPLKAGLTMAPASLMSGMVAPFAGRLADRGGRYLVAAGFTLYACGLGVIAAVAGPACTWYDLLPGFLLAGLGTGCTMSPMQTIATRNVPPRFAGAAAGVLNTMRQVGSALGSAIVLAVLESSLAGGHSYVTALRAAIAVPVVALLIGAGLALALRRVRPAAPARPAEEEAEPATPARLPTARSTSPGSLT